MPEGQRSPADFYRGSDRFQHLLAATVIPLTPEQLALAAGPGLRPISQIAAHVAEARAFWFGAVRCVASATLAPLAVWRVLSKAPRDANRLVAALPPTWSVIAKTLSAWTPAMLDDTFTTLDGEFLTRQWVIWHVLEPDIAHGGELFLTLGTHMLPAPQV